MSYELVGDLDINKLWQELRDCYNSICIRCVSFKEGTIWKNGMISVWLSKKSTKSVRLDAYSEYESLMKVGLNKLDEMNLLYDVQDADRLPDLLKEISDGQVTIKGQVVMLREGDERTHFEPAGSYIVAYGEYKEYSSILYMVSSATVPRQIKVVDRIENRLPSFGFSGGIDQIGNRWLRIKDMNLSTNIIFTFPLYIKLLRATSDTKELHLELKVHDGLMQKLRASVKIERIKEDTTIFDQLPSSHSEDGFVISDLRHSYAAKPSEDDSFHLTVYGKIGTLLDEIGRIGDVLSRPIDQFIDLMTRFMSLDELEKVIIGKLIDGSHVKFSRDRSFQRSIAWLLAMLGYQVAEFGDVNYGTIRKQDRYEVGEADIIFGCPKNEKTYVVSCKLKPPDASHIDKIQNLSEELRKLELTSVQPIIFVMESATAIKQKVSGARVIDGDDIKHIIDCIRKNKTSEAKTIITQL